MSTPPPTTIIVKFSTPKVADLTVDVPDIAAATVPWLRATIREQGGGILTNRRLRLIANGRVLDNGASLVPRAGAPPRVYIHCAVGEILSPEDLERESREQLSSAAAAGGAGSAGLEEPRGFDRLVAAGFSQEDVAQLRQQFARLYGDVADARDADRQALQAVGGAAPELGGVGAGAGAGAGGAAGAAGAAEDLVQLEERWLDSTAAVPARGDYLDDLVGLLAGMFLGVFALFLLKEPSLASRRTGRSVLGGVAINVAFAAVRLFF